MQTLKLDHKNYNKFSTVRQLVLPLDYSQMIPETEPVRLLDAVLEELDYTALLRLYSPQGRKSTVPPKILFKIIVFAMLEGIYSLRAIQRQCLVNIQYMWLLRGNRKQNKAIYINKKYNELQQENVERFLSEDGIRLRVNRSIQVESAFGQIKEDYSYKRILRRGNDAVYKELLFLALGFNIRKLHNRIQEDRLMQRFIRKVDTEQAC